MSLRNSLKMPVSTNMQIGNAPMSSCLPKYRKREQTSSTISQTASELDHLRHTFIEFYGVILSVIYLTCLK